MTEDRDLLPWILGGLSTAAIAMAIAVGMSRGTTLARASSQTIPLVPSAQLIPEALITPVPAGAVPAPSQSDVSAQRPSIAAPDAPDNQIWECSTNGVKTFTSIRCGSAAILRDVGPINVMDASPVASNVHWYESNSNYTPDDDYPDSPPSADNSSAGNSFPVVILVPYLQRRRPEHPHQPINQGPGRALRN